MSTPRLKTFAELCFYARKRAEASCLRNDPVAWAYWMSTQEWALGAYRPVPRTSMVIEAAKREMVRAIDRREAYRGLGDFMGAAMENSRIKWCNAILRAHGLKVKVSLEWMREEMEKAKDARKGNI